ncbi:MAG: Holliday junction resolvase RuvX [bacterium]
MKRIMAIDYGSKRIGIALTDALQSMAHPFKVIARTSNDGLIKELKEIITEHDVEKIVVGLPLHDDGSESKGSVAARKFAQVLSDKLGIPCCMWDERYTSISADHILIEEADLSRNKRKQVRDKLAASFILQGYLDSIRHKKDESAC